MQIIKTFLWPTPFTYVAIIVPMYLLAFISYRVWPRHAALALGTLCLIAYGFSYGHSIQSFHDGTRLTIGNLPSLISYSYFGFAFALGGVVASKNSFAKFEWPWLLLAVLLTATYIGIKYLMVVRGIGAIAYPVLHLLVLILCLLALKILCAPDLVNRVLDWPALGPFLRLSGSLSLEIYLVHAVLLHILFFSEIVFPLNILVFAALTFTLATLLQQLTKLIQNRFDK